MVDDERHEADDNSFSSQLSESRNEKNTITNDDCQRMSPAALLRKFNNEKDRLCAIKVLLVSLFVAVALGVSAAVYEVAKSDEQANFEIEFYIQTAAIETLALTKARDLSGRMGLIGGEITSDSLVANVTWPFHTVPHYDQAVDSILDLTHADVLAFSPTVTDETRADWELFVAENSRGKTPISLINANGVPPAPDEGPFSPLWQVASRGHTDTSGRAPINFDMRSIPAFERAVFAVEYLHDSFISQPVVFSEDMGAYAGYSGVCEECVDDMDPYIFVLHPVFKSFEGDAQVVGTLFSQLRLHDIFANDLLTDEIGLEENLGLLVVIRDSCGSNHTYTVSDDGNARYFGTASTNTPSHDNWVVSIPLTERIFEKGRSEFECVYVLDIYPTMAFEASFHSQKPFVFAGIALAMFLVPGLFLMYYNRTVNKQQDSILNQALQTTKLLASIFPTNVHDRLFKQEGKGGESRSASEEKSKNQINTMDQSEENVIAELYQTKPIADLFLKTTIMFADIVGFTAWSSEREPSQIFTLLETIFRAYDKLAEKLGVFKVETIGDCYVAVAGLPYAREDHAVVMAVFAKKCTRRMQSLVRRLELYLGPDTGDLAIRVGLHSGPVTAGVLRGEKSRFQLFGDSVNTAARIQTTGVAGRIHISHQTAEALQLAGHSKWIAPRRDLVTAKGKGVMRTYWLAYEEDTNSSSTGTLSLGSLSLGEFTNSEGGAEMDDDDLDHSAKDADNQDQQGLSPSTGLPRGASGSAGEKSLNRLVEWNVDILYQLLEKVVHERQIKHNNRQRANGLIPVSALDMRLSLDAVEMGKEQLQSHPVELTVLHPAIKSQLRAYVMSIANMYRDQPFHNFEHASHVMLSIIKLMTRVTTTSKIVMTNAMIDTSLNGDQQNHDTPSAEEKDRNNLHKLTYGIASDPLLQFSVAFSALIHDADHAGVPNTQLMKEDANLARKYRYRSIAEKHSIRISWERFMDSDYREFRNALCPNQIELKRFRNFVVNITMATDIADKELNTKRKERWRKCFEEWPESPTKDDVQRKATIVVEHLMQASDVAHTMQHFDIFLKWNERLFYEVYGAYASGRGGETDPSLNWYNGEIGFFDFYVIPLAKKLGACGVFGVSSDEYLNYAEANRQSWKEVGDAHVALWVQRYRMNNCQQDQKPAAIIIRKD